MPYNPQTWHDSPATDTPITAAALTHIEQGIAGVDSGLTAEIARAEAAEAALGSQVPTHPWQFTPESYGAKGDGKVIGDAVVTAGSTTLTSATAGFTSADTGKHIMINGAQGAATPLCTTITYVNTTTVALGTASPQSLSAANVIYGTDDTAAFQSMMAAMKTYAETNSFFAEAVLAPKSYCLAGTPLQTTTPAIQNAQIPVPYPTDLTGKGRKLVISIAGSGSASNSQYWLGTIPNMQGTSLVSMVVAPANVDATYGVQSVIGGPSGGGVFGGSFANTKVSVRNVTVWAGATTQQFAYDFRYLGGAEVRDSSAQAFASVAGSQPNLPSLPGNSFFQSRSSVGLAMPVSGNNADCYADNFSVEGFVTGLQVSDTFTAGKVESTYTCFGLLVDLTAGLSNHLSRISIQNYCCGESLAAIHVSGSGTVPVSINMSTELITTAHIQDAGNALYGRIGWADTDISTPTITGAANLNFVNETVAPDLGLKKVASTSVNGFTLQNGTPTILTWTPPSDGQMHRALVFCVLKVTSAETGGAIRMSATSPDGTAFNLGISSGGTATGTVGLNSAGVLVAQGGAPVTLYQSSALTAGAAILYAELWAS